MDCYALMGPQKYFTLRRAWHIGWEGLGSYCTSLHLSTTAYAPIFKHSSMGHYGLCKRWAQSLVACMHRCKIMEQGGDMVKIDVVALHIKNH